MSDVRIRWIVRAGTLVFRMLAMTWRVRPVNDEAVGAVRASGQRVIFALWHGELLPLLWAKTAAMAPSASPFVRTGLA